MYPNVNLFIDGAWKPAASGKTLVVLNPATAEPISTARSTPLAAEKGFAPGARFRPMTATS
jgi:acyl-CoA reductase-like NAD-dependent aldehyde dehydrogenase